MSVRKALDPNREPHAPSSERIYAPRYPSKDAAIAQCSVCGLTWNVSSKQDKTKPYLCPACTVQRRRSQ